MLVDTIPATCAHGRMILPLFQEIALRNKRICSSRHAREESSECVNECELLKQRESRALPVRIEAEYLVVNEELEVVVFRQSRSTTTVA